MTRKSLYKVLYAALFLSLLAGCAPRSRSVPPPVQADPDLQSTLAMQPSKPHSLDPTVFRVTVRDAQGRPVTQAVVGIDLVMPTMDMGWNAVTCHAASPGVYTGTGRFTMAGDWRITVTATRGTARSVQSFPITVS